MTQPLNFTPKAIADLEAMAVQAAWAAFDTAAIAMHRTYRDVVPHKDTPAFRLWRMKQAEEVVRLWDAWRGLYLADDATRPAA